MSTHQQKVEIALKADPENEELTKLKDDLLVSFMGVFFACKWSAWICSKRCLNENQKEVIQLTKDLLNEEASDEANVSGAASSVNNKKFNWKSKDKCMAIYRIDGK